MRDERFDDSRPEDDQEAVDRAFAELIADFHRPTGRSAEPHPAEDDDRLPDSDPPSTRRPDPPPNPQPGTGQVYGFRLDWTVPLDPPPDRHSRTDSPAEPEERYVPPPAPPLSRPHPRMLVGWLGIAYAIVAMLLLAVDVPLPRWAGWFAILAFLGGLALLLSQLPRHRPPDDDDGARL